MNRIIQKIRRHNRKSEEEKLTALIVEIEEQPQREGSNVGDEGEEIGEVGEGRLRRRCEISSSSIAVSPRRTKEEEKQKEQVEGEEGGGDLTKITKNDTTKERRQKFKHSFDRNNVIMVSQTSTSAKTNKQTNKKTNNDFSF